MRNPFDRLRQRRARRRFAVKPRVRRTGTTAKVAMFAVVVIIAAGLALEVRGRAGEAALLETVDANAVDPLDLVVTGGRSRRLLFLGDVPGATAPKRLAAEAIDTLATAYGLDAVVLDVDSDLQPWIDRYLESDPEDPSILLTRPRALRETEGTSPALLDVYRRVWRVNQRLGADRRVRIIAADLPGWPLERPLSPGQSATLFGRRDEHMLETVTNRVLDRNARARVLFFVDGVHVLKTSGQIVTGGTTPVPVPLLAGQLEQRFPREVFSMLVDAPASRGVNPQVARFRATRAYSVIRERRGDRSFALRPDRAFDYTGDMVLTTSQPGLTFEVLPSDYRLADLVDAYIYLAN